MKEEAVKNTGLIDTVEDLKLSLLRLRGCTKLNSLLFLQEKGLTLSSRLRLLLLTNSVFLSLKWL